MVECVYFEVVFVLNLIFGCDVVGCFVVCMKSVFVVDVVGVFWDDEGIIVYYFVYGGVYFVDVVVIYGIFVVIVC